MKLPRVLSQTVTSSNRLLTQLRDRGLWGLARSEWLLSVPAYWFLTVDAVTFFFFFFFAAAERRRMQPLLDLKGEGA